MNMALRPSSLLLLLLVMIPAIAPAPLPDKEMYSDTQCHRRDVFFCFELTSSTETQKVMKTITSNSPNDAIAEGGTLLDVRDEEKWLILFNYAFDTTFDGADPQTWIIIGAETTIIKCEDVLAGKNIEKFGINKGIRIVPFRYYKYTRSVEYYLQADSGLYVADELGLFANSEMKLVLHKKIYKDGANWIESSYSPAHATSPPFKPFICKITKDSKKPDDAAVKASRTDNEFSCGVGQTIFLEGTNMHDTMAYCGVGGWFGVDKKMIIKIKEKEQPYCMKDTMFEDCNNNKCFTFKPDENPTILVKIDNKLDNKFGAYIIFDSDTMWRLRLQYKDIDLSSISIGSEKFDISGSGITAQPISKVVATIVHEGMKSITGYSGKIIKFEAQTTSQEKDLMRLFGFYSASAVNEIKLGFGAQSMKGEGVANYDKYANTSTTPFGGSGVASENEAPSISGLESKISGLESKISGLESKISGLESKISDLASSISGPAPSNDTIRARL